MSKKYLEDIDFSEKESEAGCGAHIAYTFDFQGGAASGYNTALLFKGEDKNLISFEKINKMKELGEDVSKIEKDYISQLTSILQEAIQDKFQSGWDWISLIDVDFDNNIAIFCSDYGLFSVGFTLDGLVFTLDDTASPVMQTTDYQVVDGDIMVSADFFDTLISEALSTLTKSAIKSPLGKELLLKANSGKTEETHKEEKSSVTKGDEILENQDLNKSAEVQELVKSQLAEAVAVMKAELQAEADARVEKAKQEAQAEIEALRKAQRDAQVEDTTLIVKNLGYVDEGDVEAVVKHLVDHPEATELLIKTLESAKDQINTVRQELGAEKGVSPNVEVEKKATGANEVIKARAAKLKAEKAARK